MSKRFDLNVEEQFEVMCGLEARLVELERRQANVKKNRPQYELEVVRSMQICRTLHEKIKGGK